MNKITDNNQFMSIGCVKLSISKKNDTHNFFSSNFVAFLYLQKMWKRQKENYDLISKQFKASLTPDDTNMSFITSLYQTIVFASIIFWKRKQSLSTNDDVNTFFLIQVLALALLDVNKLWNVKSYKWKSMNLILSIKCQKLYLN